MKRGVAQAVAAVREWRLRRLLDAPHRLAFAAAALMLSASSFWWALVNVASSESASVVRGLPPAVGHSVLMTFGFMPMYFVGFLFTAGPKWLRLPAVSARSLIPSTAVQLSGWAVFATSLHGSDVARCMLLAAFGLTLVMFGWSSVTARLVRMLRQSKVDDKVHLKFVAVAAMAGCAGLALIALGLFTGDLLLVRGAIHASLWWFVGITFVAMAHRMIPFFSGAAVPAWDASSPFWLLWSLATLFVFEGAAAFIDVQSLVGVPAWRYVHAAVELVAGTGLLALARRSAVFYTLRLRFVTMLFVAFAWLGAALVLAAAARLVSPSQAGVHALRVAATHAYTMGFLGSTLIAMVSRVSSGHSGRSVVADDFLWHLYGLLQWTVVFRILAGLVAMVSSSSAAALIGAVALGWSLVCAAWAARCLAWYGLPRTDGRPG